MDVHANQAEATFRSRLKQVARDFGSANKLAKAIGRSEGAVRNWITGKSEPQVSDLVAICRETRTRIEWLVLGRGAREEPNPNEVREPRLEYGAGPVLDEKLLKSIAEAVEQELAGQGMIPAPSKKAEIIVNCYHFIGSAEKFDAATVARLVKLAKSG